MGAKLEKIFYFLRGMAAMHNDGIDILDLFFFMIGFVIIDGLVSLVITVIVMLVSDDNDKEFGDVYPVVATICGVLLLLYCCI